MAAQLLYALGLHIPFARADSSDGVSIKAQSMMHISRQRTYWAIFNSHM